MKTYKFKTNINCGGCVRAVTPKLDQLPSVENWQVDTEHPDKILTVSVSNQSSKSIKEAVNKAGFNAEQIPEDK